MSEVKKSSKLVLEVMSDDKEVSAGERRFGKMSGQADVCCLGEGWVRPGDIKWLGSEDMDKRCRGKALVTFAASLVLSLLRPARLEATYSHSVPRFAQRPQTGLALLHLTLEAAQAWQLSRSGGAGRGGASGECNAAMMEMGSKTVDRVQRDRDRTSDM